ncbi:MAG TPA: hypothetical protein VF911_21050 [Thermoanaerobaculia bacterium]|jgi:hypothetical protein
MVASGKLQLRTLWRVIGILLVAGLMGGCASGPVAPLRWSRVDLSREEMFLALTSHVWCDRDFPRKVDPGVFTKGTLDGDDFRSGLALYGNGTFLAEYTSDVVWGRAPNKWRFRKTGARSGVLYLEDPWNWTGSIVLFEFDAADRIRLAGLWQQGPAVVTYGRCDANPPGQGRADDLPEVPTDKELVALSGKRWTRVEGDPVSDLRPSAIDVVEDGRMYVTLRPAICESSREGHLGLRVRDLPGGGCIEAVPYSAQYRLSGRFLLHGHALYLPAGADLSRKYKVLDFFRGAMEGVVTYVQPLRLPGTIRVELWPRADVGSGFAGTLTVSAVTMEGNRFVNHKLAAAVFDVTVRAGESVQQEIELEAPAGVDLGDTVRLEFAHFFGLTESASSAAAFVLRPAPDSP